MKHLPFLSNYREDFEVVEERQGRFTLFPHTQQLAVLRRALNLEFLGGLPPRIARVDHRAGDFDKIVLYEAAMMFCGMMNEARADQLRLFSLPRRDLVTEISIVQQVTEATRRGPSHRFRFYTGESGFQEIYLSGKRLAFSDHALQRFSARVPNAVGTDLSLLLLTIFGSTPLALNVGPGRALLYEYGPSLIAFPFHETADEVFVLTCLSVNEIHSLEPEFPPEVFDLHYGPAYTRPKIRHWIPTSLMTELYKRWNGKVPIAPPVPRRNRMRWAELAHWSRDHTKKSGHGPGSRFLFVDHLPGPRGFPLPPGKAEPQYDELKAYKHVWPGYDWDEIFAEDGAVLPGRTAAEAPSPPRVALRGAA